MPVPRVVFDCNVYVQALISPGGPAGECVDAASKRKVLVFASEVIFSEVEDVAQRPHLVQRFGLTGEKIKEFMTRIRAFVQSVHDVPHVFTYQRDPQDEHYIDLAIATRSELVVSRDRDLLALMDASDPVGHDFITRFPDIRIVTPVDLLAELANT